MKKVVILAKEDFKDLDIWDAMLDDLGLPSFSTEIALYVVRAEMEDSE